MFQKCSSRHHLACLAIAALGYVNLIPSPLNRVITGSGQPFDSSNFCASDGRHRQNAGTGSFPIEMYSAGPALGNAAAVFGPNHTKGIT